MPSRVPMLDATTGTIPERFLPSGLNGTPVGTIVEYGGTGVTLDYLLCDGSAISRAAYPDLFAVVGTTYGAGDGSTTFNVPNLPKGEYLHAEGSTPQTGTVATALRYDGMQLVLPPGTWELSGGIQGQSNTTDAQTAELYDATNAVGIPNSRAGVQVIGVPPAAQGASTRSIVYTNTTAVVLKIRLQPNGSSVPSVIASGIAGAPAAWIDAKRLPYNTAKSVIKYRSVSATGTMEPVKRAIGEISEYAGTVIPTGYLPCDGSLLVQSTFPDLFAVIGTTYNTGGETALQFRLPNRKGRVAVGRDATQTEFDTLGETGGAKTHTLTTSEMPSHQHTFGPAGALTTVQPVAGIGIIGTANGGNTGFAGGDGAHNNLQPYIVLNYIIKAVGEIAAAVAPDMVPYRLIGEMFAWGGAGTPTGTLECDGSAVSRTAYPDLFAAIGTTHGVGDGSTTFNVPDMRGRTIVGQDTSQTEFDTLGEKGGAKTVTLAASEIPAHTHSIRSTAMTAGVVVTQTSAADGAVSNRYHLANGTADLYAQNNTGGGGAHNNLQPYAVMRWLIKAVWTAAEVPVNSVHTHRVMSLAGIARGTAAPSGGVDGDLYLKYTP